MTAAQLAAVRAAAAAAAGVFRPPAGPLPRPGNTGGANAREPTQVPEITLPEEASSASAPISAIGRWSALTVADRDGTDAASLTTALPWVDRGAARAALEDALERYRRADPSTRGALHAAARNLVGRAAERVREREALLADGPAPSFRHTSDALRFVQRARALCPDAFDAAASQWRTRAQQDPGHVRILATLVDTLSCVFDCELSDEVWASLHALGELARDTGQRLPVAAYDLRWDLLPHGSKPHWRYVLVGRACTLKIRARNVTGAGRYTVQVDFRSSWLTRDGPDACIETIRTRLREWSARDLAPDPIVTRLDLACDWQGWSPTGHELVDGCIVTRPQVRHGFSAAEMAIADADDDGTAAEDLAGTSRRAGEDPRQHAHEAVYYRGRRFTGYQLGAGHAVCRIYDKRAELERSGKLWLEGVWGQTAGYDPDGPVWRLEFQLRTPFLRSLLSSHDRQTDRGPHAPAGACGDFPAGLVLGGPDWRHIRAALDPLWAYLTGRGTAPALRLEWAGRAATLVAALELTDATRRWAADWIAWSVAADGSSEPAAGIYREAGAHTPRGEIRSLRARLKQIRGAPTDGAAGAWLSFRASPTSPHWPTARPPDTHTQRWPVLRPWAELARARWPDTGAVRLRRAHEPRPTVAHEAARAVGDWLRRAERYGLEGPPPAAEPLQIDLGQLVTQAAADAELKSRYWTDDGRVDLDTLARALGGPTTLSWLGSGPRTPADEHPAAPYLSHAETADTLARQVRGTLATLVALRALAHGADPPPTSAEAFARITEEVRDDEYDWGVAVGKAATRHAVRAAFRFDRQRIMGTHERAAAV